jgi:two-component system, NtrC family, sensor kinase
MKQIVVFFLLMFLCNPVFSQPSPFDQKFVDSITARLSTYPDDTAKVNNLAKLASMYLMVKPDLTIQYAKQGVAIAEKINYYEGKINCLGQSAFCLTLNGEWAKATIDVNEGIALSEKYQPSKLIYWNNVLFLISAFKGDYKLAIQYSLKSINNPAFSNLSETNKWATYMQIGRGYEYIDNLDSAQFYAKIVANDVAKYGHIVPELAKDSYTLFGNIAFKRHQFTEAFNYYRLGGDDLGTAKVYQQLNKADSTIFYSLKSLEMGKLRNIPSTIQESAKILAKEYAQSNPKEANKYLQIYIESKDSLYNSEKLKQLEEITFNEQKTKFEIQKKETADRNWFMLLSLLAVLATLFIYAIMLWRNNRFKQKANFKLETTLKDLKSTQTQLIQKEKLASLGELTAGIAHEIQNPLNFVNNFSELSVDLAKDLKEEIHKPNIDKEYVEELLIDLSQNQEKINHHGKRASSIVKGMLEHSRASTGVKEMTDINALADEYFRLSYHGLRAKDKDFNATMETDFDKNLPKINLIPQDMGRVLLNLFNNAFYAVNEKNRKNTEGVSFKPTVTISTQLIDNQIVINVKDNGTGMSEATKAKVFQPFFTTKPTGQGTGLGLSLAYDIVTKGHGGAFELVSTEGVGTEFILKLNLI